MWLSFFRISERQVDRYVSGNVLLSGDAAHVHSPAGGQGMNTGVQDAFNLGWKLALILREGGDRDVLLRSYHAERHPVAAMVIARAAAQTRMNMLHSAAGRLVRDGLLWCAGRTQRAPRAVAFAYSGLDIRYRGSPILSDDTSWHKNWRAAWFPARRASARRAGLLSGTEKNCLTLSQPPWHSTRPASLLGEKSDSPG